MTYAYFLDYSTFEIKDVQEIQDFNLSVDEETNSKTTFSLVKPANAHNRDFVFIKDEGRLLYQGIIDEPSNDGGTRWDFTAKYITNLFDRKIILDNQELIKTTGIEDFIAYTIEHEFTNSSDTLLNLTYIDVEVKTHTPKNYTPNTDSGIYNFHTFINNMTQKFNIIYKFDISNEDYEGNRLKMTIESIEDNDESLIDCNVPDIINYEETYKVNVTAKVVVLCSDNTTYTLYLLNDRTTTEDATDPNRALGDIEVVYEYEPENARQTALNFFKGNGYEHLIQFMINKNCQLFDVSDWVIGQKIKIKNKAGDVIDSYISAYTIQKNSDFIQFKTGNMRIDFIDKIKQERSE